MVLFNVSSVWLDGRQLDTTTTRSKLPPGTEVLFWDRTYGGGEYSKLSEGKVLRQALAVAPKLLTLPCFLLPLQLEVGSRIQQVRGDDWAAL